jgi:hypothetical protein
MYRLAEYILELSKLLGCEHALHLIDIEEGSTVPVIAIDFEEEPKVRQRLIDVKTGAAPREASAAEAKINKMLAEDNGTAWIGEEASAQILQFPGSHDVIAEEIVVDEYGTLDGEVTRVGGQNDNVPLLLKIEGSVVSGCASTKEMAKELGKFLYEPVRLHGTGKWKRDDDGWSLIRFRIDRFEPLERTTLRHTVDRLRGLRGLSDLEAQTAWHDLMALRDENGGVH